MDAVVQAFLENEQRLRLVKRLGRGGFGEVWQAESPSGVRSAVKVSLDPIDGENPAVKKELQNLDLVKTFSGHPHIVGLLDYWLVTGFLVTRWESATDGNLLDMLERNRSAGQPGIPLKQLRKWIAEAADGLDFLHANGIYHRDIKPENLLLFHGHVKIGDLGLMKLAGASTASHSGSGTFGYLPPEAWEEHRLTSTADLYSLAATYVKLRTGREPFGTSPVEIADRQMRGRPVLARLTEGEAKWVRRALAPRPEDRPQEGAAAWVQAMYKALRGPSRGPSPASPPPDTATPSAMPKPGEDVSARNQTSDYAIVGGIGGAIAGAETVGIPGAILGTILGGIPGAILGAILGGIAGAILGAILGAISGAIDAAGRKKAKRESVSSKWGAGLHASQVRPGDQSRS
ncbi:MAG: protein kinase [Thermogutta sp.]|nr:protein kinase [Thermogutta sp.]